MNDSELALKACSAVFVIILGCAACAFFGNYGPILIAGAIAAILFNKQ